MTRSRTPRFYIQHRTNYWGSCITGTDRDKEVSASTTDDSSSLQSIVWTQVCDRYSGCCPGFGERGIQLRNRDFLQDHAYHVYKVSETQGRKKAHYFYKFIVIPEGTEGCGEQACFDRGWEYIGDIEGESARSGLKQLLWSYKDEDHHGSHEFVHLHVGLVMDEIQTR